MAPDDYRRHPRKNEIYGWNIGLTSTTHGRTRRSGPTGFGGRTSRPSDTASRSRKCVSRTAPRLQVLTKCFGRQYRRRAHHERELAKRRRTRRPLPLRLRHNGNVTKALHATPSSASSWGRAPTITRLQALSRIQPCTRITRIRIPVPVEAACIRGAGLGQVWPRLPGSGRAASTAVACSRCIKVESGTF